MAKLDLDDIKHLSEHFATKQDLEKYATKEDLASFERRMNDRFDQLHTVLRPIEESHIVSRQEHQDFREEIDEIKSLPTIAHELKVSRIKN